MSNRVSLFRERFSVSYQKSDNSKVIQFRTSKISISLVVGVLLALSGGFMDAYSYVGRGGVFANAQTGNMVLLGIHLSQGHYAQSVIYAVPIAMFILGIALAEIFRVFERNLSWQHEHVSLLVEIIAFSIVSTLQGDSDLLANVLISFVCGIQFESFRRIHGKAMTTTVCMGNIRTATQLFVEAIETKNINKLKSGSLYLFITICFVAGAVLGYFAFVQWSYKSIFVCVVFVGIALSLMILQKKEFLHLRNY